MKPKPATYYVEVAPTVPLSATGKQAYTYHIKSLCQIVSGEVVNIPFAGRFVLGVVLNSSTVKPAFVTKPAELLPNSLTVSNQQLTFARHIADSMHGGLGYTLRLFLPPVGKEIEKSHQSFPSKVIKVTSIARKLYKLSMEKHVALIESDEIKRRKLLLATVAQCANQGKQAIIIVPELSMLSAFSQLLNKFFPNSQVAMYHAGLPGSQVRKIWHGVNNGDIAVVVGTQKSLFLPWKNIALIVIEQEYYATHKLWDQYPRLHNVSASYGLATIFSAHVLSAGSFPSLELRKKITDKQVECFPGHAGAPALAVTSKQFEDKRQHLFLPQEFVQQLTTWAKRKQKIFLLCNKRGAWQVALCRVCHKAHRCPTCGLSMLAYKGSNGATQAKSYQLVCRQCALHIPPPAVCSFCKKGKLQFIRPGVETIETVLRKLMPRRTLLRLDADTLSGRTSDAVASDIKKHQIILGTNAVLTHLEGMWVDKTVWLFPEDTLLFPDIRSAERAWYTVVRLQQLIKPGTEVVAVTSHQLAVEDVFKKGSDFFIDKELVSRRRLSYPPFTDMVRLTWRGKTAAIAGKKALTARRQMEKIVGEKKVIIRGPYESLTNRGLKEVHILLLGSLVDLTSLYRSIAIDVVDVMPERIL